MIMLLFHCHFLEISFLNCVDPAKEEKFIDHKGTESINQIAKLVQAQQVEIETTESARLAEARRAEARLAEAQQVETGTTEAETNAQQEVSRGGFILEKKDCSNWPLPLPIYRNPRGIISQILVKLRPYRQEFIEGIYTRRLNGTSFYGDRNRQQAQSLFKQDTTTTEPYVRKDTEQVMLTGNQEELKEESNLSTTAKIERHTTIEKKTPNIEHKVEETKNQPSFQEIISKGGYVKFHLPIPEGLGSSNMPSRQLSRSKYELRRERLGSLKAMAENEHIVINELINKQNRSTEKIETHILKSKILEENIQDRETKKKEYKEDKHNDQKKETSGTQVFHHLFRPNNMYPRVNQHYVYLPMPGRINKKPNEKPVCQKTTGEKS